MTSPGRVRSPGECLCSEGLCSIGAGVCWDLLLWLLLKKGVGGPQPLWAPSRGAW